MSPAARATRAAAVGRVAGTRPASGGQRAEGVRRAARGLLVLAAAAALALGLAQPYAADGGFDRPLVVAREQQRPLAALALDRGVATLVHVRDGALVAEPLDGGPMRRLDDAEGVRGVLAAGGIDRPLVAAWYRRDPTSGQYVHLWSEGGELGRWVQPLDLVVVASDAAPVAFVVRGRGEASVVERWVPGAEPVELYRTELRLSGLSAAADTNGAVHLTWLEGRTDRSPLGTRRTWKARAAVWWPGDRIEGPLDLGAAFDADPPTTTTWWGGRIERMWVAPDGAVRVVAGAGTAQAAAMPLPLRPGQPVAAFGDQAFVAEGSTLWRLDVGPDAAASAVPVTWSPVTLTGAWAVRDRSDVTHLAWVGTEAGGTHSLYVANDRRPMVRTWRDELAARLGWSPWNLLAEAAGQTAASLLVAVLAAMAAAPLMWLAAIPFAGRGSAVRARWRGAAAGALVGPVVVVVATLAGASPAVLWPLLGGPVTFAVATALGGVAGGAVWARRDMEPTPAFVTAGATAVAATVAVVAFAAFQRWLALALI